MPLQANLFDDRSDDLANIQNLIDDGYLFVINHSGGKDSQAMTSTLKKIVPMEQLLVVHADLGEVEWAGNKEHIRNTIGNLPMIIAQPNFIDGSKKGFFEMVLDRFAKIEVGKLTDEKLANASPWPSPSVRQCTSDLKTGPINREIRRHIKNTPFENKVVNCIGIRADESSNRAKKTAFRLDEKNSTKKRTWYEWLPIFGMSEEEVYETIREAGQEPHWAYKAGMSRLSCVICIMASVSDLTLAATMNPELYKKYVMVERYTGKTMMMPDKKRGPRTLEEITGIDANVTEEDYENFLVEMGKLIVKSLAEKAHKPKETAPALPMDELLGIAAE